MPPPSTSPSRNRSEVIVVREGDTFDDQMGRA